jgi:serine/threonine protein kinase
MAGAISTKSDSMTLDEVLAYLNGVLAHFSTPEADSKDAAAVQAHEAIIKTIKDIAISDELTDRYCGVLKDRAGLRRFASVSQSSFARGCLLFLAFNNQATLPEPPEERKHKPQEDERDVSLLKQVARNDDFRLFLKKFYVIPEALGLSSLAYHASGTTSFIFKASTLSGHGALKIIQAPYTQLEDIRAATKAYKAFDEHTDYSPKIYECSDLWIFMEFLEGCNLNEYLNELRAKHKETPFLSEAYITAIAGVFRLTTEALEYYEQLGMIHGDLTPFNIMIEHESGKMTTPKRVKLIDFGPNYVLKTRLSKQGRFVEAFSRTELFTAPEVVTAKADPSIKSDFYSLGMIGLEMLSDRALRKDAVGVRLRDIWQDPASAGIAEIIEDLIDENPDNRLLILQREKHNVYSALNKAIQAHVDLYKDIKLKAKEKFAPSQVMQMFSKNDVVKSFLNMREISKMPDVSYNNVTPGQRLASGLNLLCLSLIVLSFTFYTYADLRQAYFPATDIIFPQFLVDAVQYVQPRKFAIGDVSGNLPGRLVALTFGFIAARYYANIFAPLRVTELKGYLQPSTNFLLRANCVTYFVPIMAAIVYNPKFWPYCALFGTVFPALNNLFCWRTAKKAAESAEEKKFSLEIYHHGETEKFLNEYKEWWVLMLSYSITIGVVGVLLDLGYATDEKVYAGLVCFVNIAKVYRNNCGREAPKVAGSLSRLFFAIRRCAALEKRKLSPAPT